MINMKPKAILLGLGCFILISMPFYFALALQWSIAEIMVTVFFWLQYVAIIISGALTAYISLQKELINGILLGILIAIFFGIANYTWAAVGLPADSIGFEGNIYMTLLSLPITVPLSAVGALCVRGWRKLRTT